MGQPLSETGVRAIAKDVADNAINKRIVGYGAVITLGLLGNMTLAGTIIVKLNNADIKVTQVALDTQRRADNLEKSAYTIQMAVLTEWYRHQMNPTYNQVDIRKVQKEINEP